MFRSSIQPAILAFATIVAVGFAGCAGSHSVLPGMAPQTFDALRSSRAGEFTRLSSQPPVGIQIAWLLTDGSILAQSASHWSNFYRYVPDAKGNYADGTWSQVGSLQAGYGPDAAASDLLADGRLVISGGEYNRPGNGYDLQLTNLGAVYDPLKKSWTPLGHPKGWGHIGDSPSSVLPDGRLLIGEKLTKRDAYLDPKTLQWRRASDAGKADFNSEEGWTLLADGTILTADVKDAPHSEIYNPSTGRWKGAGSTIVDLHSPSPYGCLKYAPGKCYYPPGEIGPSILRPDGTVLYTGSYSTGYGAGHTAIYDSKTGKWTAGPDFPNDDNAGDSYATLEPSGNVLVFGLRALYEWNGKTFTTVNGKDAYYAGPPILLPTGEIMMLASSGIVLYKPPGSPAASWAPRIRKYPATIAAGMTYKITGTQFNGLGQAMSFGDEFQNATNYPLVRITNNSSGAVLYARTHDHSTMGVATGSKRVWTYFDVPKSIVSGASTLEVVANGIASKPVSLSVSRERRH